MKSIFEKEIWHNTGLDYIIALAIFVGLWIVFAVFVKVVLSRLKKTSQKTKTDVDDFLINLIMNIKPPFYFFIALYVASRFLIFPEMVSKIILGVFIFVVVLQVVLAMQRLVDYVIKKRIIDADEDNRDKEAIIKLTGNIIKGVIWVLGFLMVLSNLGVNITSLITGLGIGGIAVALALQNILGDMFASFSIFTDKPFKVGDFITIGQDSGTVEKIGIKTTRIITLEGQELVIPNKTLTEERINNYGKMEKRRVVFSLGVTYGTKLEQLLEIPKILSEIISKQKNTDFDRAHFNEYGDSSLNFEIVYYINNSDFVEYRDIQQSINLEIFDKFQKKGIEFAFPSQTIYLEGNK